MVLAATWEYSLAVLEVIGDVGAGDVVERVFNRLPIAQNVIIEAGRDALREV